MKFSNSRSNNKNRTFKRSNNHHRRQGESSNNAPKVTGNLTTVLEKYKNLAKDASSAGDYVTAENYLQHAEHFARVIPSEASGLGASSGRRCRGHIQCARRDQQKRQR